MDKQQLHTQLLQLGDELKKIGSVDDNQREILQKLVTDIQDILERKDNDNQEYGGLGKQLRETIAQLEASHPKVSLLMRQLIDELYPLGI